MLHTLSSVPKDAHVEMLFRYFSLCSDTTFIASSDISLTLAMVLLIEIQRKGTQPGGDLPGALPSQVPGHNLKLF